MEWISGDIRPLAIHECEWEIIQRGGPILKISERVVAFKNRRKVEERPNRNLKANGIGKG